MSEQNPTKATFADNLLHVVTKIDIDSTAHVDWVVAQLFQQDIDAYIFTKHIENEKEEHSIEYVFELTTSYLENNGMEGKSFNIGHPKFMKRYYVGDSGTSLKGVVTVGLSDTTITILVIGEYGLVKGMGEYIRDMFAKPNEIKTTNLSGFGNHGAITNTSTLDFDDPSVKMAHPSFYPFIDDLGGFIEGFDKSDETMMLFVGDPGTGKSTLLRTLMLQLRRKTNITISAHVALTSPSLIPYLHSLPDDCLVMVEDADEFCRARKSGNANMSALLNWADGIVGTRRKMVISTNIESTKDVDPALMRGGRNYALVNFRRLTASEAIEAVTAIGVDSSHIKPDSIETYSLGEAISKKKNRTTRVGFIRHT